jgi:hypothetical protein
VDELRSVYFFKKKKRKKRKKKNVRLCLSFGVRLGGSWSGLPRSGFGCLWVVRVALTLLFVLGLVAVVLCWCSPLLGVGLVLGVLLLPVGLLAACCLWLLVLVVCWWLCLLLLFVLLVSVLLVPFSVVVWVVLQGLGVLLLLPSVVVGVCCCGCPLAVCLLLGLVCPGLRLVLLVLLAVGGSVFPFLLLLLPCSCPCFSFVVGFLASFKVPGLLVRRAGDKPPPLLTRAGLIF